MNDSAVWQMSGEAIAREINSGNLPPEDAVETFCQRARKFNPQLNAFLEIYSEEDISSQLTVLKKRLSGKENLPLAGVPLAIKDNICIRRKRVTCASKILANFVSPYSATVIELLERAGAIFVGKTNLDEFAMGSSTENSAFGPTRNPWNLDCVPGGSSGGSAAAVAAGLVPLSLGSDTGGSIRQPAAFCGITGLKPTYGLVSRYGLVAFASSLDQIGPFARDIGDIALMLEVISGADHRDSTSLSEPSIPYRKLLKTANLKGKVVGLPKEYFTGGISPEVEKSIQDAQQIFRESGVEFRQISLPHTNYAVAAYYIIAPAEASSNLSRYDSVRYGYREEAADLIDTYKQSRASGFGTEVKRRIMLGTYVLSAGYYEAYYGRAQRVRTRIREDFIKAFQDVDFILTPTAPTPAFTLGEKITDPLQMYLSDIFTIAVNLAGIAAISLPCGFSKEGLPIGMQLIFPPGKEAELLQAASIYQQQTAWHKYFPERFNNAATI